MKAEQFELDFTPRPARKPRRQYHKPETPRQCRVRIRPLVMKFWAEEFAGHPLLAAPLETGDVLLVKGGVLLAVERARGPL